MKHKIPDDLIITLDQTPSKLLNVGKNIMAKTNSKRVALRDSDEKRAITITIAATLTGEILPFQMIYDGKTARSRPDPALLPDGFLLCGNSSHWSNAEETINLLNNVIKPYVDQVIKKLGLPENQKALLIWDDFRGHTASNVQNLLPSLNIVASDVPKNLTHLLSPLDLTVNRTLKRIEQDDSAEYISAEITRCLQISPRIDDIKVNTGKPILRNLHAKTITKAFAYFQGPEGKQNILQGWKAAGIWKAVKSLRDAQNIMR